jgi:hypothetical protein
MLKTKNLFVVFVFSENPFHEKITTSDNYCSYGHAFKFLITLGYDVLGSQAQENLDFNKSSSTILSSFTAIIMA